MLACSFWVNSQTDELLSANVINVLNEFFLSLLFVYLFWNIEIKSLSSASPTDEAAIQDLSNRHLPSLLEQRLFVFWPLDFLVSHRGFLEAKTLYLLHQNYSIKRID